jgi:hypothetical protein
LIIWIPGILWLHPLDISLVSSRRSELLFVLCLLIVRAIKVMILQFILLVI